MWKKLKREGRLCPECDAHPDMMHDDRCSSFNRRCPSNPFRTGKAPTSDKAFGEGGGFNQQSGKTRRGRRPGQRIFLAYLEDYPPLDVLRRNI